MGATNDWRSATRETMNKDLIREIAEAIAAELLFSNWRLYAILAALFILSKAADVFIEKYLGKRAEIKAAAADLHHVVHQLEETTKATEAIRIEFSRADWLDKEWRSVRRVKLEELLSCAQSMLAAMSYRSLADEPEEPNPLGDKLQMLCTLYFPELQDEVMGIYETFKRAKIHYSNCWSDRCEALNRRDFATVENVQADYSIQQKQHLRDFLITYYALGNASSRVMLSIAAGTSAKQ
jgi:hypothetical protein